MAEMTRVAGPIVVSCDESPLYGKAVDMENKDSDPNTVGTYEADLPYINCVTNSAK